MVDKEQHKHTHHTHVHKHTQDDSLAPNPRPTDDGHQSNRLTKETENNNLNETLFKNNSVASTQGLPRKGRQHGRQQKRTTEKKAEKKRQRLPHVSANIKRTWLRTAATAPARTPARRNAQSRGRLGLVRKKPCRNMNNTDGQSTRRRIVRASRDDSDDCEGDGNYAQASRLRRIPVERASLAPTPPTGRTGAAASTPGQQRNSSSSTTTTTRSSSSSSTDATHR
jgi:hypothetical protein